MQDICCPATISLTSSQATLGFYIHCMGFWFIEEKPCDSTQADKTVHILTAWPSYNSASRCNDGENAVQQSRRSESQNGMVSVVDKAPQRVAPGAIAVI